MQNRAIRFTLAVLRTPAALLDNARWKGLKLTLPASVPARSPHPPAAAVIAPRIPRAVHARVQLPMTLQFANSAEKFDVRAKELLKVLLDKGIFAASTSFGCSNRDAAWRIFTAS